MGRAVRIVVAPLLACVLLAGCWDRREPEELAHALVAGFDIDDKGFYEVIVQFPNTAIAVGGAGGGDGGGGGGGGGGLRQRPFWTHSAKGRTPFEAVRNLSPTTTRLIVLSHVGLFLISEKLARHGIGAVIDFVKREPQARLSARALVVDGDIKKLLDTEFPLETSPATGLLRFIRLVRLEWTITVDGSLVQKVVELTRPGEEMTLSRIEVLETEDSKMGGPAQGASTRSSLKPPAKVSGGAAFRGDKMVGWLDTHETRGWNWMLGKGERGPILLQAPGGEGLVTIDLLGSKSMIEPVVDGTKIRMRVKVKVYGRIEDLTESKANARRPDLRDPEVIRALRRRLSQVIRNDIEISISKAQELGADIFGFGNTVYRKHPKVWKEFAAERWDELFKTLPVDISVEAIISRPGLVFSSLPPRERR